MPKDSKREPAITYRPLAGGLGLGLPTLGLGLGLGLGGVQPAAPTAVTAVDGGNPSVSNLNDDDGDAMLSSPKSSMGSAASSLK